MKFTDKHIECAKVCARLEISGQNTKEMALECGGTHSKIYNWLKQSLHTLNKVKIAVSLSTSDILASKAAYIRSIAPCTFKLEFFKKGVYATHRKAHRVRPCVRQA